MENLRGGWFGYGDGRFPIGRTIRINARHVIGFLGGYIEGVLSLFLSLSLSHSFLTGPKVF